MKLAAGVGRQSETRVSFAMPTVATRLGLKIMTGGVVTVDQGGNPHLAIDRIDSPRFKLIGIYRSTTFLCRTLLGLHGCLVE